jgi:hypothetical protein
MTENVVTMQTGALEVLIPTETVVLALIIVQKLGLARCKLELSVCQSRASDLVEKWKRMS